MALYVSISCRNLTGVHKWCQGRLNIFSYLCVFSAKYGRFSFSTTYVDKQPLLTPQEVNAILRSSEFSHDFSSPSPVKSFDSNQLPSNSPMEDARAEARCMITDKILLGVFDGHAGAACAQVVANRLFNYLFVSTLPRENLLELSGKLSEHIPLKHYNLKYKFIRDLKESYDRSLNNYVQDLINSDIDDLTVKEKIKESFLRLDNDLSTEAEEGGKQLSVGLSGSVVCVAQIDKHNLYVASVGDCQAVLGSLSDSNTWIAKKLSVEHNSDNPLEVERILSEHPENESSTVITTERLLGQLAPLRAFGDFRYKWSLEKLKKLAVPYYGNSVIPPNYLTPPYLTALPDVTHHRLTSRDKFLVIATDGLWDLLSPLQAVRLVGEYMGGRVALTPLRLPRPDLSLGEVARLLEARQQGLAHVPLDSNAATHLIRHALGDSDLGLEHYKISQLLSIPQDVVRLFRDDISITVAYFDSDYIRVCPSEYHP